MPELLISIAFTYAIWHFLIPFGALVEEQANPAKQALLRAILFGITFVLVSGYASPSLVILLIVLDFGLFFLRKKLDRHNHPVAFIAEKIGFHLLVIVIGYITMMRGTQLLDPQYQFWNAPIIWFKFLAIITGFIWLIVPIGRLIGLITQPFLSQLEDQSRGLKDAGKIIGQLERCLIYILVLSGNPSAVGFLIAAKSILRFPELKSNNDHSRKESEYIIIGTLLSFLVALIVSLIFAKLIDQL